MRSGRTAVAAQAGFTYIGLLIVVAIIAASATAALEAGAAMQQREVEAELLAIGLEFRHALQSYADTTPAGQPTEPKELAELLRDARQPGVQRHLRRIYLDPLTGKDDWGLEKSPDGRIAGIHSRSTAVPLRRENFPIGCEQFARAEHYTEWVFAPTPIGVGRATQNR